MAQSESKPEIRGTGSGSNGISTAEDFRAVIHRANIERVVLPSGLTVILSHLSVFSALNISQEGSALQAKIAEADPANVPTEDIAAFSAWLTRTLERLFVQPVFSATPQAGEIGLADIAIDDLKYIFRWLRGEVIPTAEAAEDLETFPGGRGAVAVPGARRDAQPVPPERAS